MAIATLDFSHGDLIGKPFKWGGRGPDFYDCYGLVEEMSRRIGRSVPDYTSPTVHETIAQLIEKSVPFWTPCEEEPGAVATIRVGRHVAHVGFVLPYGKLLHSWELSGGVTREPIEAWKNRITGFYKFPQ